MSKFHSEAQVLIDTIRSEESLPSEAELARVRKSVLLRVAGGALASSAAVASSSTSAAGTAAAVGSATPSLSSAAAVGLTGKAALLGSVGITTKLVFSVVVLATAATGIGVSLRSQGDATRLHSHAVPLVQAYMRSSEALLGVPASPSQEQAYTETAAEIAPVLSASKGAQELPLAPAYAGLTGLSAKRVQKEMPTQEEPKAKAQVQNETQSVASSASEASSANARPRAVTAAELEVLRDVQSALYQGQAAHALKLLEAHAARFQGGPLEEEQRAVRIIALCKLGREQEARQVAETFSGSASRTLLAARVRNTCAFANGRQ